MTLSAQKLTPLDGDLNEGSPRILLAGDESFQRSVSDAVKDETIVVSARVRSGENFLDTLTAGEFDCVVIDQMLDGQSSLAQLEMIAARFSNPPPMVVLAADSNPHAAVKAFRAGAADYISRDRSFAADLIRAIRRSTDRHRAIQKLYDDVEYLSKMANYDRLTGLANRNFLEDRIGNLIASCQRHGTQFALLLIDINNFKQINDVYGHAVGDQALKTFAKQLMNSSRSSDVFGRLAGDEFVYLIDRNVSQETIEAACDRLGGALALNVELDNVGLALTASIGAAVYPTDGRSEAELLNAADEAMYAAKANHVTYCLAQTITVYSDDVPADDVSDIDNEFDGEVPGRPETVPEKQPESDAGRMPGVGAPQPHVAHRDENRRIERRYRVYKRGRIVLNDKVSTIDCMIRDLSTHGARVTVEDQIAIPLQFSFSIIETGAVYPAIRRWQRGTSIGIEILIDTESTNPASQHHVKGRGAA